MGSVELGNNEAAMGISPKEMEAGIVEHKKTVRGRETEAGSGRLADQQGWKLWRRDHRRRWKQLVWGKRRQHQPFGNKDQYPSGRLDTICRKDFIADY